LAQRVSWVEIQHEIEGPMIMPRGERKWGGKQDCIACAGGDRAVDRVDRARVVDKLRLGDHAVLGDLDMDRNRKLVVAEQGKIKIPAPLHLGAEQVSHVVKRLSVQRAM